MKIPALEKYTVRDVLDYRGRATLEHSVTENDTIEDALALMNRLDIVSVPVFRCPGESKPGGGDAFVDIVSVYDLRDYIVNSSGLDEEVEFQLLSSHASGNATVLQTPIAQVVRSRTHAPREIDAQASLETLMRLFTEHRQHRVLVTGMASNTESGGSEAQQVPQAQRKRGASVDSGCSSLLSVSPSSSSHDEAEDRVAGYLSSGGGGGGEQAGAVCGLTQYDVLRFIQHHNHELGHRVLDTTVAGIMTRLPPQHLFLTKKITVRDSALHALKQLSDAHASALPVVDYDGKMVTEVAGASLRSLTTQSIGLLGKPVLAYMFGLRIPLTDPYVVHPSFNVSQIMYGMLRINCRRAWVVDSDERPLAVISLADVLSHLL
ncbi:hypothetical protein IWW48_001284 [Coemansia sp. RSA 1200]|nr:hypothetical protein IWW48_001284 [Coemansia sp. RSA 1200]